ncbi:PspC domain-containing protein [Gordonia sp. VNK21]|uniref:PspC domain-containing protein n=1 Tax=Gordonia sp. VNK21 TaxID=3382483 RepID=UPI0038D4D285
MNRTSLHDLWATRPVRRRSGRKVAGVCSGFGARYDVDPTLIRVAFVVATMFGGGGVLLYVAAWIALPSGRTHAARHTAGYDEQSTPRSSRRPRGGLHDVGWPKMILLAVLLVVVFSHLGDNSAWNTGALAGVVLMLLGWWLLYQRTPVAPAGTSAADPAAGPAPAATASATGVAEGEGAPEAAAPYAQSVPAGAAPVGAAVGAASPAPPPIDDDLPPSWDPLGTARFAWDLPEPPPPAPEPEQPRSALTPVTLGLAVLAAGGGTAANLLGADWFTVGRIAALSLAVIGAGLLVAGLQRRQPGRHASGLLPLGVLGAAVVIVATLLHSSGWALPGGGAGERTWKVSEAGQLADRYELTLGSSTLDLRDLGALDGDRTVTVEQGVGDVTILLPEKVRTRMECSSTVGDVDCPPGIRGRDADQNSPLLTIKAHSAIGSVEARR